ncbi:MAG: phage integrase N-terminal SAM-like domain-containing protein [Deltaproteobacteria bacterium]|nr:phage integrase N-terminal SAM-like domain-containing protein [Deltaproteobacteria bacterium]
MITGSIHKKNTVKSYEALLRRFNQDFGERSIESVTTDEILEFLNEITEGKKQQTKRIKYAHLSAFFNFIRANINTDFRRPCDSPMEGFFWERILYGRGR